MGKLNFRSYSIIIIGVVLVFAFSTNVFCGSDWPTKRIEYVTHSQGTMNRIGTLVAEIMREENLLSQPMTINLKRGSGMAKAFSFLLTKKGNDHYVAGTTSNLILATPLKADLPYRWTDFTMIANLCVDGSVIVVKANGPYNSMEDIIDAARKKPNQLAMGCSSITSNESMMGKVMQQKKSVKWKIISFDTEAKAAMNVMGSNIDFAFLNPIEVNELVRAGELKVVLAASSKRYKAYPDAPTIGEAGLGKPQVSFRAVIGPPDMPDYAVEKMESVLKKVVKSDRFQKFLSDTMMQEDYMDAKGLTEFMKEWEPFIKSQLIIGGIIKE